ncbi:hypothetical protein IJI64_02320 [Candidatus Saccharibacteria bacterium]|nr:hypothetical protein [Candidatus Saccharibacteria bacterium]
MAKISMFHRLYTIGGYRGGIIFSSNTKQALIDVIRNIEPELFTKVTGLTVHEFDQMCEVGVFKQTEINAAIAQFRRFEDSSLEYAGGRSAHDGDGNIGLFDTVVTRNQADEIIEAEIGG